MRAAPLIVMEVMSDLEVKCRFNPNGCKVVGGQILESQGVTLNFHSHDARPRSESFYGQS